MRKTLLLAVALALLAPAAAQANHGWSNPGAYFDSGDPTNQNATCGEATYYTAVGINAIFAGSPVNGAHQANCPGPHPNASAKWQQWINADGDRLFDCLYDEDANSKEVTCHDLDPIRLTPGQDPDWVVAGGGFEGSVDGSFTCGEANAAVAGFIYNVWGSGAISGAYSGNCAGPHPSSSSKWVQWGGPGGNVMYDCLYDEDPPNSGGVDCFGQDNGRISLGR